MASLTHVCMWSKNGWVRITAEEAAQMHPGGTVSAYSGLFMCELCGQYVTLTDGDIRKRYFKHSAYEKSKNCPERTFGAGCSVSYDPKEHELPIRITVSFDSFRFEIGLVRVPIALLSKELRIEIRPRGKASISYIFSEERLNYEGITYLPIGERPYEKYTISLTNGSNRLYEFWPSEMNGIDPEGTLFEKRTGKKLVYDADVEIAEEYYLLKRVNSFIKSYRGVQIELITRKQFGGESWCLYQVSASAFNEDAARFFLDFHCRLTEKPVSLQMIWPLLVEDNYIVKHNQDSMYAIVEGNASEIKTFPIVRARRLDYNVSGPKLYEVNCSERQQLISAGRTQALQYTYLWKEALIQEGTRPKVSVTDANGLNLAPGEMNTLPSKKILRVIAMFDGNLIIYHDNHVVEKRKIVADRYMEIENLTFGMRLQLFIGLDVVWEICFRKQPSTIETNENEILRRIIDVSGTNCIRAPHSLKNILLGLRQYPRLCQWIRKCMKNGTINEQSYRRLQETYRSINS